ncbi:IclR family transcriptional regulator [Micromonospora sp. LOL_023]|uniref:IclR family transcriptional regulator n=1 Tax=Micromonospora sp. LOL_023 TaxID=3345418 RepID=UPI003A8C2E37
MIDLDDDSDRRRGVRSVARALDILTAFSTAHPRLHLSQLAEAAGLPRPSAHRIAVTLVERGFLRQDPDGAYLLGIRLLELGNQVSESSALTHLTQPAADELARITGETVLTAEVDWSDCTLIITGKRQAAHPLAVSSPVGRRSVLGGGCIGKAALSGLPPERVAEIVPRLRLTRRTPRAIVDHQELCAEVEVSRARGYAIESGEYLVGVAGVAVPVTVDGRVAGALAVIGPASRFMRRQLDRTGQLVRQQLTSASPGERRPVATAIEPEGWEHL